MNADQSLFAEISYLTLLSVESKIDKPSLERLNTMLQTNSQARSVYLELINVHLGLESEDVLLGIGKTGSRPDFDNSVWEALAEYEKTAPVIELPKEKTQRELIQKIVYPSREKQRISKLSIFTLMNVAAVILFFVVLRFVPSKGGIEVATLTDSLNAKWADVTFAQGTRLKSNGSSLVLREGMAELLFDTNTKVVVEAPAEFELVSKEQIYLRYGRLYATVPVEGVGFSVNTSNSRIIDLGTEFGVNADAYGNTVLHVMKGKTLLIAGDKTDKKTLEVTGGDAKKVSAQNLTVSDISYNDRLFVREIDSAGCLVWRGETVINLADIVGGGNGFGGGTLNTGIDAATGKMISRLLEDWVKVGFAGYKTVDSSLFIDGVFVPGLEDGETAITADGSISVNFPKTSGNYWGYIMNGAFHKGDKVSRHTLRLNGMSFGTPENPSISIHSNQGITFDLSKIRQNTPMGKITEFRSLIGISETVKKYVDEAGTLDSETLSKMTFSTADFWVFLDGKKVYELKMSNSDGPVHVEIPISDQDRFLTLAVTEADSEYGWAFDWALFGRPELIMEPAK